MLLAALYPSLSIGGIVIIDDFHLKGVRRAVAEFRREFGVTSPLLPAPLDYLACPLTRKEAHRATVIAEDHARRARAGRVFASHNPLALRMDWVQNAYWMKTSTSSGSAPLQAADGARSEEEESESDEWVNVEVNADGDTWPHSGDSVWV